METQTITINMDEYKELLRKQVQLETIFVLMRRDYSAERNTCYRDCIDILESFDEDFPEWCNQMYGLDRLSWILIEGEIKDMKKELLQIDVQEE